MRIQAFDEAGQPNSASQGMDPAGSSPVGRKTQSNVEAYSMANVEEKIKNTIMEAFAEIQYANTGGALGGGNGHMEQSLVRIEGTLQTLRDKLQVVRRKSESGGSPDKSQPPQMRE